MEARASVPDRQINEYKVECGRVCVCVREGVNVH